MDVAVEHGRLLGLWLFLLALLQRVTHKAVQLQQGGLNLLHGEAMEVAILVWKLNTWRLLTEKAFFQASY
ncbi:hypothetical protein A9C11_11025 [Pseudomonas citronellolis]|uniref:Uncharacterized protein n=1 Tax=Pseudomonas citronellolis TaxID=53408 RepID=A0A1A9KBV5_9PSED|nr:hypothetical protein A9C11_11025 [Pseudomonas citronellolis]